VWIGVIEISLKERKEVDLLASRQDALEAAEGAQ